MRVTFTVNDVVDDNIINYIAASPPDYRTSYTGSGLPFFSYLQAFDNTPNKGEIQVTGMDMSIDLMYPNSFYMGLGTVIVPPTLYISYVSNGKEVSKAIPLSDGIPYRMLTYPMKFTKPRRDVTFYDGTWDLPVRTQEQILRDSSYPATNHMASNFWGLKPPC